MNGHFLFDGAFHGHDRRFVAPVKRPLLDALGADQARLRRTSCARSPSAGSPRASRRSAGRRRRPRRDRRRPAAEMGARVLQPVQDLQPPLVGQRLEDGRDSILPICQMSNYVKLIGRQERCSRHLPATASAASHRGDEAADPALRPANAAPRRPTAPTSACPPRRSPSSSSCCSTPARSRRAARSPISCARRARRPAWSRRRAAITARRSRMPRMRLGVPATIFVPQRPSPAKIERIRGYGAELVVAGDRYADALAASEACGARTRRAAGARLRPGRDAARARARSAWSSRSRRRLDTVLVAVGGGGLIGGIAAWYAGRVTIVGGGAGSRADAARALAAGAPVDAPAGGIAADSLAPRRVGELMFPIAQRSVERVVLVTRRRDPQRAAGAVGRRCAWWPSPAARRPSPRCCPAPTSRRRRARRGVVCGGNTTAVATSSARRRRKAITTFPQNACQPQAVLCGNSSANSRSTAPGKLVSLNPACFSRPRLGDVSMNSRVMKTLSVGLGILVLPREVRSRRISR